jgi:hypothetical protein
MTNKRNIRGSDKAMSIPLTCKVSPLQLQLIRDVLPPGQAISEWLRLAALSAAYHERHRIALEAVGTP